MTAEYIKQKAKELGASVCGIGNIELLRGEPMQRNPFYILPKAKAIIGFGIKVPRGLYHAMEDKRQYYNYANLGVKYIDESFAEIFLLKMGALIENEGYDACLQRSIPGFRIKGDKTTNPEVSRIYELQFASPVSEDKPVPDVIHELYPERIKNVPDIWKTAPISFEAYWWLGEWKRQGWDIDDIIEKTLGWHISMFNAKSLPIPEEWRDKVEYWISKMGYHFAPDYFKSPEHVQAGESVEFELCMENCGVAAIYEAIPLKVRLTNETKEYVFDTDIDIRKWLPGKHVHTISICLPETMASGKYDVGIGILGKDTPMIYLCTDAVRNGRYYKMGKLMVE